MMTAVRLRTNDYTAELCHGWCETTGQWQWFSNSQIDGAITTSARPMPLDRDDDPENYWWVITPTGTRIAFQSIDVEEI